MEKLREEIERHASAGDSLDRGAALEAFLQLRDALESGDARAALRREGGDWEAIPWVKQGILLGFRLGAMEELPQAGPLSFVDKQTFPPRRFSLADGVRVVPGGSAVRRGA